MSGEGNQTTRGFRVTGRVQGVGFRWWTQRTAQRLGLAGSVRNCPDGSVEVQVVGEPDVVARLESALREGPPASRVERIARVPADPAAPRSAVVITS
ncbi:MAG TPA: acylphosphatase [Longimicrobiales bacterium]|nr:acylphosphatase [Longimicrobiales bacterium]